jgi:hypothetical protein
LRSAVAERYSPASANKILSALRGVTTEAWRLGQLGAEDRERIAAVAGVKGSSPLRGRALKHGETAALSQNSEPISRRANEGPPAIEEAYGRV